jgi:lipopolysaccharide transport system ATP-binding protein
MDYIIETRNIGKKYDITHERGRYIALRDVLMNAIKSPFSFLKTKAKQVTGFEKKEEFWALKNVSFNVKRGEVVGIIGANGAGKSTLLKILSQITPPTEGEIILRGRVGSLLEVGTGFHPELTGRENIFLNGAILGMKRKEIAEKFDEIVEFAGIGKFLDTPVKYYSSGMYVRLAFSVAAHMDPDILIIDEVLAVGDAEFQKKCLGKMEEIAKSEGRTILFVSHNIAAITRLCRRTILLKEGKIVKDGPTKEVTDAYLHSGTGLTASKEWPDIQKAPGDDIVRLCSIKVKQENQITSKVDIRLPVEIEMEYDVLKPGQAFSPDFYFYNEEGTCIFMSGDFSKTWSKTPREIGRYTSVAEIPANFLTEGAVIVGATMRSLKSLTYHFWDTNSVVFHVIDSFDGSSARGDYAGRMLGVVRPLLRWTTQFNGSSIKSE